MKGFRLIEKSSDILPPLKLPPRQDDKIAEKRIRSLDIGGVVKNMNTFDAAVFEALARLVIELEEQIPNYDTLLSDDASGRLITLFLREVINKKREALGRPRVQTSFISGGRQDYNNEAIEEFIKKNKSAVHKALLVTEIIGSGESVNRLVKIFEREGLDFDIAAVSFRKNIFDQKDERLGGVLRRVKYGVESDVGLRFWNKPFTGVSKHKAGGWPVRDAHPVKDPDADRGWMKSARHEIKLMAEEISKLIMEEKREQVKKAA